MEKMLPAMAAAVVFNIILSLIWYSPKLLGSIWLKAYQFKSQVLLKPKTDQYIGTALVSIVLVIMLSILIQMFKVEEGGVAVKLALILWAGFIATTEYSAVLWEKKPLKGYFIDAGYWLISLLVITPLLALWK